jgi:hypothetical protein
MKLLHIPSADPFSCHIFEVNEFPKDDDLFIMKCHELDDFITEVLNPRPDSLLGIEIEEEDIECIETSYRPGVQRLIKAVK